MRQSVDAMLYQQERLKDDLKIWVTDRNIPLDERWEVFIKSGLGTANRWHLQLDSLPNECVHYDGIIHCDRYQTMKMDDVIECLQDAVENWDHEYGNKKAKDIVIVDVQEEILQKFIKSFTYDW